MTKLIYRITKTRPDGQYKHLEIDIKPGGSINHDDGVQITFQADHSKNVWSEWYGFHVELRADGPDDLKEKTAIAKMAMAAPDTTPLGIIAHIDKHAMRAVYDSRMSENVPVSELAPDGWKCFYNDACSNYYKIMARDDIDAKERFVKAMKSDEWSLRNFLRDGCAVHTHDGQSTCAPIVPDIANELNPATD